MILEQKTLVDRAQKLLTPYRRPHKMRATKTLHNSDLAQLVEQMTVNHWVAGSSPAVGAISNKGSHSCDPFLFLPCPFLLAHFITSSPYYQLSTSGSTRYEAIFIFCAASDALNAFLKGHITRYHPSILSICDQLHVTSNTRSSEQNIYFATIAPISALQVANVDRLD